MLKITRIIFIILTFTFVFALFSVEIRDPDFWWHVKTGEYIYQTRSLPVIDPFSYTSLPKDPVNPESKRIKFILTQYWLAQVFFYWVYHIAGFQGIIFLRAALLSLLVFFVYRSMRREGAGLYFSMALLVPVILILHTFTGERPQLFSFLFSFLLIFLLEGFRKKATRIYDDPQSTTSYLPPTALFYLLPLPFIMLLWANIHGGFIVGIFIIFSYLIPEWIKFLTKRFGEHLSFSFLKILTFIAIISVAISVINPNTYTVIPFIIELEKGSYVRMITEFMPPLKLLNMGFYEIHFIIYFILLFTLIAFILINIKKSDLTDIVLLSGLTAMSLSASRGIPYFTPAAVLIIARCGKQLFRNFPEIKFISFIKTHTQMPVNIFFIVVLTLMLINGDLFKSGIRKNVYPEGAVQFLKDNKISGNMFNPYVWGGYLLWELYPDYKVFIDGRGLIGEVFFQEVMILEAHPTMLEGIPEWEAMLKAYKVNLILIFSVGNFTGRLVPLVSALMNNPEWHLIFIDNISLIFLRDSPENEEMIKRFSMPKEWAWNEVAVEATIKAQDYPNNPNFYITAGDAFLARNNYFDAKEAFLKALERDPGNSAARKRIQLIRSYGY